MGFSDLWKRISESDSFLPSRLDIQKQNTDVATYIAEPFERNKQYFSVVVNEMFLAKGRQWFTEYTPTIFVVSEFIYDGRREAVPYVVGPTMLKDKLDSSKIPDGFVFEDTTVAGLHPYRGGNFTFSIVLARAKNEDHLRRFLKLVENTAATYMFGFGKMISQYIKVAGVVLDGIDSLMENGDIKPLVGHRREFQGEGVHPFNPGYFVLINASEEEYTEDQFFVKKNRLFKGDSMETAVPFREADYVLYSILPAKSRTDIDILPFNKQFTDLQNHVMGISDIGEDERKVINAKLFALQDNLRLSPDLTRSQVDSLIDEYREEIRKMINRREPLSGAVRSAAKKEKDDWEQKMDRQALAILTN